MVALICILLMTSDIEYLVMTNGNWVYFQGLLAICIASLEKCVNILSGKMAWHIFVNCAVISL